MRAIPEKTLEHWSSMYLARRFPDCQLWWPSAGEDVSIRSLPRRFGKSLLLEIKTTDWNTPRWEHRLTLDVDQLRRYQRSPVPVYYVLPMPPWQDVPLEREVLRDPRRVGSEEILRTDEGR